MEEVLKADVFFFVTTIAVAIFTVFGTIVGIYIVRILREVEYMARVARKEVEIVASDIGDISESLKKSVEGMRGIGGILSLLINTVMDVRAHKSRKHK